MFNKIKRFIGNAIEKPLSVFDWAIFFVLASICFLCFQQGDILHTAGSALTYLNGHILDFYDFNAKPMGVNNYLPSSYILFAIWDIPLKLFGIISDPKIYFGLIPAFWFKLLPSLFYMASSVVIYYIGVTIGFGVKKSKLCAFVFLTTPLAFFSQFIFGQYDIFTVFFMLLGLYFYFKNNLFKFVLFLGIAITFKYFPAFIFFPLLLLKEKDIWKLIKKSIFVLIPLGIEIGAYILSQAFRNGVFGFGATGYIFTPSIFNGAYSISIVIVVWLLVCGWAYFKDITSEIDFAKWGLFFCNIVIFLLFGVSSWHPQWLLFAVPFMVLTTFMSKKFEIFIFLDILIMFFFVIITVNNFQYNVDQQMFTLGILKSFANRVNELPMSKIFLINNGSLMFSFLSGLLLINAIFKHPRFCLDDFSESIDKHWNLVRARFVIGVSIFVIPAFICLIGSQFLAVSSLTIGNSNLQVIPLKSKTSVLQVFIAKTSTITKITVQIGTYQRVNNSKLKLILSDLETGKELYSNIISVPDLIDNGTYKTNIKNLNVEKGKKYLVTYKASNTTSSDYIALYATTIDPDSNDSYAIVDGTKQNYDCDMGVYGY
jgi:hypothetical protein